MGRVPRAWGLVAVTLAATLPAWALPVAHTIERVPFVRQQPNWCGAAALESVLRYHGADVSQRAIAQEIALPNGEILNLDLKLYARRKGFRADSQRGDLDLLKSWIARDVPVICQVRLGGIGGRTNHFVVVFGYDDRKRSFTAHTGTRAAEEIPFLDFANAWRDARNWMLVIRSPETKDDPAQPASSGEAQAPPAPESKEGAGPSQPPQSGK